jgi:hypothetical protein
VLSGKNVSCQGEFHLVETLPPNHEVFEDRLRSVLPFVRELKRLCDEYFASQDKARETNYEDIAYIAQQIEDGITSEYENPALLPLNQRFLETFGREQDEQHPLMGLQQVASDTLDCIRSVVREKLAAEQANPACFTSICDAFGDSGIAQLDLATLNHDVVVESALRSAGATFSDGFKLHYGTLKVWTDEYREPSRRLIKLHGSLDTTTWRSQVGEDRSLREQSMIAPTTLRTPMGRCSTLRVARRFSSGPSTRSWAIQAASTPTSARDFTRRSGAPSTSW